VSLSGGTAARTTANLSVATHTITAVYSGSATFGGSTGILVGGQAVSQAGTTTTITGDSPDPSVVGAAYTVSVTVTAVAPSTGTPTGSVSVSDGAGGSCSITLSGGNGTCSLTSSTTGGKTLTATYPGSASFIGSSDTEAHQVDASNSAPVAVNDGYSVDEDGTLGVNAGNGVLKNDTDADGDPLTALKLSDPANGTVTLNSNGSFTYAPAADFNGSDSFTYRANDGLANSNTATVTITVNSVNDAPSFTMGPDETASVSAGAQTVAGWAKNMSPGPSNESGQTLAFEVSTNDDTQFTVTPSIDAVTGDLTYTPDPLGVGASVTVTVRLRDNGGTANGGVDVTSSQTFTITLTTP
jgi:VCBS repeat-containing protein